MAYCGPAPAVVIGDHSEIDLRNSNGPGVEVRHKSCQAAVKAPLDFGVLSCRFGATVRGFDGKHIFERVHGETTAGQRVDAFTTYAMRRDFL